MKMIEFYAMGSQMAAFVEADSLAAEDALAQVPSWFEEWEQVMSRFRIDSELSLLNANPGWPAPVGEVLWEALAAAREAAARSGGLVTPVVLEALEQAGYDRSFDSIDDSAPVVRLMPRPVSKALERVVFNADRRTVMLPPDLRLDLGGVGKGWAAHQAAGRLRAYGPALVDAGGDLAASGPLPSGKPWLVAISDPHNPDLDLALVALGRGGLATSGRDYRRWRVNGKWHHHIIDPRSGQPADTDVLSASVLAPDVMQAEMAAKTVLILGSRAGLEWLERQPGMDALLVLESGDVVESAGFGPRRWR